MMIDMMVFLSRYNMERKKLCETMRLSLIQWAPIGNNNNNLLGLCLGIYPLNRKFLKRPNLACFDIGTLMLSEECD